MPWSFVLTDLYGTPHGEVTQATQRKVSLPHLRVPSCSFTMPLWHELASKVLDTDCLVQAWRTDMVTGQRDLAFHGPVVSADENAEGGAHSIAVNAAGPYWRLTKRLIPDSKRIEGVQYGSEGAKLDLGVIARTIIQNVNSVGFTGIDLGTHTNTITGFVTKWHLKNAAEAIAELAAGLNSFEFEVRPTVPTTYANAPANFPRIGLFDTAPLIGTRKVNAVFEFGTPRGNVSSYTRNVSRESLLTKALISSSGWPDGAEREESGAIKYPLIERDADTQTARGVFEEVVSDAGVLDNTLRTAIADLHLDVRKNPRQQITFRPAVNARPAPFVDYKVGDEVRCRAFVRDKLRFDAWFRIWGLTIEVGENGDENVELELVMP